MAWCELRARRFSYEHFILFVSDRVFRTVGPDWPATLTLSTEGFGSPRKGTPARRSDAQESRTRA